jgi:hypothetical protein
MTKAYEEKPDEWGQWGDGEVKHAGGDIYYTVIPDGIEAGGKATHVWVWHWHTPTDLPARWQISGCGLHTVEQVEPLTLSPSLACEDGCPSHGFLENGQWRGV